MGMMEEEGCIVDTTHFILAADRRFIFHKIVRHSRMHVQKLNTIKKNIYYHTSFVNNFLQINDFKQFIYVSDFFKKLSAQLRIYFLPAINSSLKKNNTKKLDNCLETEPVRQLIS